MYFGCFSESFEGAILAAESPLSRHSAGGELRQPKAQPVWAAEQKQTLQWTCCFCGMKRYGNKYEKRAVGKGCSQGF